MPPAHTDPMAGASERGNTPRVVVAVAVVGLLSTLGASLLGGVFATVQVKTQLDQQRDEKIEDQRREVYLDFLRATSEACQAWITGDKRKADPAYFEVLNQEGRVKLIAGDAVGNAAHAWANAIVFEEVACQDNDKLTEYRDPFVRAAAGETRPTVGE